MAPIAVAVAKTIHAHRDPFLMAVVAIGGASCSFLTPLLVVNFMDLVGPPL